MSKKNNLLNALTRLSQNPDPFIVPVFNTGISQVVYTVQNGRAYTYTLPKETPAGWWLVEVQAKFGFAGVVRRATIIERMEYLRQLPRATVLTVYPTNFGYVAMRLHPPDTKPLSVFLINGLKTPVVPFAVTTVRELNGFYLYDTTSIDNNHALIQERLLSSFKSGGRIHGFSEPYLTAYRQASLDAVDAGIVPVGIIPGLCLIGEQYDLSTVQTILKHRSDEPRKEDSHAQSEGSN